MDVDMINSDACLTTVQKFSNQNTIQSCIKNCSLVYNYGAFSSQLENTRNKVFSCLDSNKPASYCRSSKTNNIERQSSYCFGHLDFSLDALIVFWI